MPLVRIDIVEGRSPEEVRRIADTVHEVILEEFDAPPGDRYQIITEHPPGHIIAEDTGLGFRRTDAVTVVQVLQQGRSDVLKKRLYAELARRLEESCGVPQTDLIVAVSSNKRADWSFGLGRAQFLEGDL